MELFKTNWVSGGKKSVKFKNFSFKKKREDTYYQYQKYNSIYITTDPTDIKQDNKRMLWQFSANKLDKMEVT